MNANDFRRIALSLPRAKESSHMGSPDFRLGGRIFATLASQNKGYGNLMLDRSNRARSLRNYPVSSCPPPAGGVVEARRMCGWHDQRRHPGRRVADGMEAASRKECQVRQRVRQTNSLAGDKARMAQSPATRSIKS